MVDQISRILMLSDLISEDNEGCYNISMDSFLIENNGVVMEQIAQWLVIIILPITTIIFVAGGIQACRTHGFSFDSNVLFLCAIYNMIFLWIDQIQCTESGEIIRNFCYSLGILYLFFNFEWILKGMEKDIDEMKENLRINRQSRESNV